MKKNQIGIVILNYKTYELTLNLVRNIKNVIKNSDYFIVVVDNASCNESDSVLAANANKLGFDYIHSSCNGGYAKGNNLGIKRAIELGAEYILISNNDIIFINDDTLEKLKSSLDKNNRIGVVSPRLIDLNGKIDPPIYFKKPTLWDMTLGIYSFHKKRLKLDTEKSFPIYAPRGSCMMCRTEDLKKINSLDERTFLYYEEPILAERYLSINKISFFCGDTTVIHNHGKTISTSLTLKKTLENIINSYEYYLRVYRRYNTLQTKHCILFRKITFKFHRRK